LGKSIAVVIPAHNEALVIGKLISSCLKYTNCVLVVDDFSTDGTASIALESGAGVYAHTRNWGYGGAIMSGLSLTRNSDIVVTLDGDGQHDPNVIPEIVAPILKGDADVVIGSRFIKGYGNLNAMLVALSFNLGHKLISDPQSGYRAYSQEFLNNLILKDNGFGITAEILVKARKMGYRIVEVPISCDGNNLKMDNHMDIFRGGAGIIAKTISWRLKVGN
jgi:glycosyltransferase involved in cell wall biosynthesis